MVEYGHGVGQTSGGVGSGGGGGGDAGAAFGQFVGNTIDNIAALPPSTLAAAVIVIAILVFKRAL